MSHTAQNSLLPKVLQNPSTLSSLPSSLNESKTHNHPCLKSISTLENNIRPNCQLLPKHDLTGKSICLKHQHHLANGGFFNPFPSMESRGSLKFLKNYFLAHRNGQVEILPERSSLNKIFPIHPCNMHNFSFPDHPPLKTQKIPVMFNNLTPLSNLKKFSKPDLGPPPFFNDNRIRHTWLGHASCLISMDGLNILTDPVLSQYVGFSSVLCIPRYTPQPIHIGNLIPIDVVILSHSHHDHVDASTIGFLGSMKIPPRFWIVPLGMSSVIKQFLPESQHSKIHELDWWQSISIPVPSARIKSKTLPRFTSSSNSINQSEMSPSSSYLSETDFSSRSTADTLPYDSPPSSSIDSNSKFSNGSSLPIQVDSISSAAVSFESSSSKSSDDLSFDTSSSISSPNISPTQNPFKPTGSDSNKGDEIAKKCLSSQCVTLLCLPAQHWSGRILIDKNISLWCGWAAIGPSSRMFFSGDSGYAPFFDFIGKSLGPFDLSLLPVGAYLPRATHKAVHMNPDDAMMVHLDVRSVRTCGIHYGTFGGQKHWYRPITRPFIDVETARRKFNVVSQAFFLTVPGKIHDHISGYKPARDSSIDASLVSVESNDRGFPSILSQMYKQVIKDWPDCPAQSLVESFSKFSATSSNIDQTPSSTLTSEIDSTAADGFAEMIIQFFGENPSFQLPASGLTDNALEFFHFLHSYDDSVHPSPSCCLTEAGPQSNLSQTFPKS